MTRPIGGGATEPLPDGLSYVWSWPSPTGLFGSGPVGDIVELRVVNPASGTVRSALADLKRGFYGHGQLSPDGRWASAMEWLSADRARIIIFPFRPMPVPPVEWVALTEDQSVEEEHVWSPQADAIYFVSERDGNRCVWMRKLDPATKHPVGPVMPVPIRNLLHRPFPRHHHHRGPVVAAHNSEPAEVADVLAPRSGRR